MHHQFHRRIWATVAKQTPWLINLIVASVFVMLATIANHTTAYADPLTLTGPAIGQDIPIEANNTTGVPDLPDEVGEVQLTNNMLLLGHRDWASQIRPFGHLLELNPGDILSISDGRQYAVRDAIIWNIDGPINDWNAVVAPSDHDTLTLVSCTGPFSQSRHVYLERVIIQADRIN